MRCAVIRISADLVQLQGVLPDPGCFAEDVEVRPSVELQLRSDTRGMTTDHRLCLPIRLTFRVSRTGAVGVELTLIAQQLSLDEALVVALFISVFIVWALRF